ncbi:MAG: hypothetical protein PW734_03950 [Verrucomicrobium sp.]|nr:hypothetical protein [Verrucomicrobium sp.]
MASSALTEDDIAALRETWHAHGADVRDYLWTLQGRKDPAALRAPLHAAFLRYAALLKPPADTAATLFRFAREAAKAPSKPNQEELLALKFRHGLSLKQIGDLFDWKPEQVAERFHAAVRAYKPQPEPAAAAR